MSEVDWRDMFWRYIEIVGKNEGVDFLHEDEWPPHEWEEIQKLDAERVKIQTLEPARDGI
jgi:hypothetical protein